ncbi:Protein PAM71-homolog, chloroplastic [Linum grandiflorum]
MQGLTLRRSSFISPAKLPSLNPVNTLPCCICISPSKPIATSCILFLSFSFSSSLWRSLSSAIKHSSCDFPYARLGDITRLSSAQRTIRAHASNISIGSGGYEGGEEEGNSQKSSVNGPTDESSKISRPPGKFPYPLSIVLVLLSCAIVYSLIVFVKRTPSSILAAISKSGLAAAFSLIFVSEIGDKTFFIAALLAMQYEKGLVLLGSMAALSLMTVLSVVIGRIFQSVPAQFQTTLPIGEYAAIALLLFFGIKSIKDAWDLPSADAKNGENISPELDEYASAEELVKEKLSKRLTNPFEIVWKSFSLVFFAEWGDRSMLATIALGAAQSPWGVATGAIAGHLVATSVAVVGGAFLANYISEKLVRRRNNSVTSIPFSHTHHLTTLPFFLLQVGYVGGVLFLVFAVATFFGVF